MAKRNDNLEKLNVFSMNTHVIYFRHQSFLYQNFNRLGSSNFTLVFRCDRVVKLIGFLSFGIKSSKILSTIKLREIFILNEYRNLGYGTLILNFFDELRLEVDVSLIRLIVLKRNKKALNFYSKNYFQINKENKNSLGMNNTFAGHK